MKIQVPSRYRFDVERIGKKTGNPYVDRRFVKTVVEVEVREIAASAMKPAYRVDDGRGNTTVISSFEGRLYRPMVGKNGQQFTAETITEHPTFSVGYSDEEAKKTLDERPAVGEGERILLDGSMETSEFRQEVADEYLLADGAVWGTCAEPRWEFSYNYVNPIIKGGFHNSDWGKTAPAIDKAAAVEMAACHGDVEPRGAIEILDSSFEQTTDVEVLVRHATFNVYAFGFDHIYGCQEDLYHGENDAELESTYPTLKAAREAFEKLNDNKYNAPFTRETIEAIEDAVSLIEADNPSGPRILDDYNMPEVAALKVALRRWHEINPEPTAVPGL